MPGPAIYTWPKMILLIIRPHIRHSGIQTASYPTQEPDRHTWWRSVDGRPRHGPEDNSEAWTD
eukprot:2700530-Pyramimonas_sp.AAC.1